MRISDWSSDVCSSELSVTKLFYDRGWNGINIEPDPVYFAKLTEERPRDHNLSCAAGELDGTTVFYDVDNRGRSTSDAIVGQQYVTREVAKEREVKKLTLDTIIATPAPGEIHYLKIEDRKSTRLNSRHYCANR